MNTTESELEFFRQQWRQDISKRAGGSSKPSASKPAYAEQSRHNKPITPPKNPLTRSYNAADTFEDSEPRVYHDLESHDDHLTLAAADERHKAFPKEPKTALEHYERAVEKESAGRMGDSVSLYRKAFKLDDSVHEQYKQKHFPARAQSKQPSNTATQPAVAGPSEAGPAGEGQATTVSELIDEFSQLSIPPAEPETDLSPPPPCPIASIPEEILIQVLEHVAVHDVGSFARLSLVCKRLAYLTTTEDRIWKRVALGNEFGFAAMLYRYVVDLRGRPLHDRLLSSSSSSSDPDSLVQRQRRPSTAPQDMTPVVYPTYRSQFRMRPRLRFNGCYISTVNYTRPGASHQSQYNWNSPVLIVTYYRYLRFFRDGTVISLLTTTEPAEVVHHLKKENLEVQHSNALPTSVMKEALRGRWRLTGPASTLISEEREEGYEDELHGEHAVKGPGEYAREPMDDWMLSSSAAAAVVPSEGQQQQQQQQHEEAEGGLCVETEGVSPKYLFKMQLAIGSAGRKDGARNNKLSWRGFWSYNRLTDDWAEFGRKYDRTFYFSRVKSYGMGWKD